MEPTGGSWILGRLKNRNQDGAGHKQFGISVSERLRQLPGTSSLRQQ